MELWKLSPEEGTRVGEHRHETWVWVVVDCGSELTGLIGLLWGQVHEFQEDESQVNGCTCRQVHDMQGEVEW